MTWWQLLAALSAGRRTSLMLTGVAMSCAVLLVAGAFQLRQEASRQLTSNSQTAPLVVGAGTSPTGLMLSAVFLVDSASGLVPLQVADEIARHPSTRLAVPYALGDTFLGRPVVATTPSFFDERFPAQRRLADGRTFANDGASKEAVIGSRVAADLDLRLGDKVEPTHGTTGGDAHLGDKLFEVVGILAPQQGALDDAVLIPLEAFLALDEHAGADAVSAILVVPKAGMQHAILQSELQKRSDVVVADTARELDGLRGRLGRVDEALALFAVVLALSTWLGVTATLWTSARARLPQLALLRFIGARLRTVVSLLVAEGVVVGALAGVGGIFLSKLSLGVGAASLTDALGFSPDPLAVSVSDLVVLLLSAALGGLASTLAAVEVYRVQLVDMLRGQP